jgi:hypothetical protein
MRRTFGQSAAIARLMQKSIATPPGFDEAVLQNFPPISTRISFI